jgi:hypothetical protein
MRFQPINVGGVAAPATTRTNALPVLPKAAFEALTECQATCLTRLFCLRIPAEQAIEDFRRQGVDEKLDSRVFRR